MQCLAECMVYSKCSINVSDDDDDNNKHEDFMNRLIYRPIVIDSYF